MRLLLPFLCAVMTLGGCASTAETDRPTSRQESIRAMTFNIRYDNAADGEHAWPHRRERVAELIRTADPDCIALQEVLSHQLSFLTNELGDEWEFVGVGRSDGKEAGEFSPIGYRRDRFTQIAWGTWWLSPTPQVPSRGWDAALPRIATWIRLHDVATGETLLVVGTHFDHRGEEARVESARFLANQLNDESRVILMGDFNAPPGSLAHRLLTTQLTDTAGDDTRATWCGWDGVPDPGRRIDWILSRGFSTERYEVPNWDDPSRPESDHLPVMADLR